MMRGLLLGGLGWIGAIFCLLVFLGVIAGIVWLIIWAVRSAKHGGMSGQVTGSSEAIEIVKQRYARGEINEKEYKTIIDDLHK